MNGKIDKNHVIQKICLLISLFLFCLFYFIFLPLNIFSLESQRKKNKKINK